MSEVERRRPDWWALESAVTERRDIVDEISDATGYFHDSEAAKLRHIAATAGMKPVGIVRAAVEQEIDDQEFRCVYFDDDEDRGYPSWHAFEYYRIHRAFQLEYEAAMEALPKEENAHLREVDVFEHAADTLDEQARRHRAKAEKAEQFLTENGYDVPDVEDPRPETEEKELVTDGGEDVEDGIRQLDPTEYPTRHAFRLVNDAHTNLCIVGNEIEDDELTELEDEAREALIDLFDAMAEQRGFNEQQFEDVYLNEGLEVWGDA